MSFSGYASDPGATFEGALFANPRNDWPGTTSGTDSHAQHPGFAFDASKSSDIYSSDNVQTRALQTLICIKI